MTIAEFFKTYNGKSVDYDNAYGVQCFDLANEYVTCVLNGKQFIGNSAYEIYTNFNNQPSRKLFTRIKNTPAFTPIAGDIMVWGKSTSMPYGHVAICDGQGNTRYFYSYDQNWTGHNDKCTRIRHSYDNVLGVLRPKILDYVGFTHGSNTIGSYALKKLMALDGAKIDDNAIIGSGSVKFINNKLKTWGYVQYSVAGYEFIKCLYAELKRGD